MVAMATTEHGKTKSLSCGSGPRFGCNSGMYKYFAELPCAVPGIAWFESLGSAFVVCYVLAGLPPSIYQYTHFAELELNFLVLPHHLHWVLPLLSLCRMPTSVPETVQTPSFSASAPSAKKKTTPGFSSMCTGILLNILVSKLVDFGLAGTLGSWYLDSGTSVIFAAGLAAWDVSFAGSRVAQNQLGSLTLMKYHRLHDKPNFGDALSFRLCTCRRILN